MIKFKLNGKSIDVATSWDDLTFNQFLKSFDFNGDTLQAVSIASGLDYEYLKNHAIIGIEALIQAVQFLKTPAKYTDPTFKLGKYTLPLDSKGQFNPQFKRLDQFEDMRKAMIDSDKGVKSIAESYAIYCAIYIQEFRDKEYSFSKAMAMVDEVKQMPAKEVVPAGSFFLLKLLSLLNGIKKTSPPTNRKQKKLKRGSRTSVKSSGRMRR